MTNEELQFAESIYQISSVEEIHALLSHPKPEVRGIASLRLRQFGKNEAARNLVVRLRVEVDLGAKRTFIAAIACSDQRTAKRWLTAIVATFDDPTCLYYALDYLRIGQHHSAWVAEPLLHEERPVVLFAALHYLHSLGHQGDAMLAAIDRLTDLLTALPTDWASTARGDFFMGRAHVETLVNQWRASDS